MKTLIRNRRSAGWNLIEIIVAVAIGASIAAAGVVAYQGEAKKAAVAKAKSFISQVESKKAALLADVTNGNASIPTDENALAAQILPDMKVQGVALTGTETTDAGSLGFDAIHVGTLDTIGPDGKVSTPGTPASVTLKNGGGTISGNATGATASSGG